MANNKLLAAAIAGLLTATSPLAAMAEHDGKSHEANGCDGKTKEGEETKEGEANECKGHSEKE